MALSPKQRQKALEQGLRVNLSSADEQQYVPPTPQVAKNVFARAPSPSLPEKEIIRDNDQLPIDREVAAQPTTGRPSAPADGRPVVLTADRRTDPPADRETAVILDDSSLPADRRTEVSESSPEEAIPLAPIQWAVLEALQEAERIGRIISRRHLAKAAKASIRGVRDALAVIEKAGGIRSKVTVRTAEEQGLQIELDHSRKFRPATRKETKGLLKREFYYRPTADRQTESLPAGRRRMSVCNNVTIRHTDMAELLRISPAEWQIREQTLIQIADALPDMTAIEFRRSLAYLVEQAQEGKQPVQNPNAWIKAAFEKNGGPLVTERMIDARMDQKNTKPSQQKRDPLQKELDKDLVILRQYVAASVEEKVEIDRLAEERVERMVSTVSPDKHAGIREQARIECAREYFASKASNKFLPSDGRPSAGSE